MRDAELITQSAPGQIFVARNIGNLVQAYEEVGGVSAIVHQQLDHLRTHPTVGGRLAEGKPVLAGSVSDFGHGIVLAYNNAQRKFLPVTNDTLATPGDTGNQ
jgi:carbonic anhydrase